MKLEIAFKDGRKEIFDNVASFNVIKEQDTNKKYSILEKPTEGIPFEVKPLEIDRSSFEKPMKDKKQEWTRQSIQKAFAEVDKQPEKYASPFYTLIPVKHWNGYKTITALREYAKSFIGGLMADRVEQALEWAQRICNGESWEDVCNNPDTANYCRVIEWENGCVRLVGGSRIEKIFFPASDVCIYDTDFDDFVSFAVPLVVIKKR